MANNYDDEQLQTAAVPKKADVILRIEREISARQEDIFDQNEETGYKVDDILDEVEKTRDDYKKLVKKTDETYNAVKEEYESLKRELRYLAAQNENIFDSVAEKLEKIENGLRDGATAEPAASEPIDYETLADRVASRIPAQEAAVTAVPVDSGEIDYDVMVDKLVARLPINEDAAAPVVNDVRINYDELADKVAARMPAPVASGVPVQSVQVVSEIDYDLLADKVAERMPAPVAGAPVTANAEIDYDLLAEKVAERMPAPVVTGATVSANAEIDYDLLADKVVARIPLQDAVSPDYIAARVAEQIVVPEATVATVQNEAVDYDELAQKISERVSVAPVNAEINEDSLADKVASRISEYGVPAANVNAEIDEENLADRIALKVGAIRAEDFDILVDDDGCSSISKTIIENLDYEYIASAVAEKLRSEDDGENGVDYDEMAARISENITVAGVNEDAIAEKAAAVLSNYMPDIDTDEIADKVASQLAGAMPTVDNDYIASSIAGRIIEQQSEHDYEIVIDDEGVAKVSDGVSENVVKTSEQRFDAIDEGISEIKEMLANGVVTVRETELAPAEAVEEPEEEPEETEELVTVSELVGDVEEPEEEKVEEIEEPAAEEVEEIEEPETEEEDEDDDAEEETLEEFSIGDFTEEGKGGVDFANMMRYNRSFIARIIQGTDEQKNYYGSVRNALLSYKKVNSNIAWGAERFHKGRETIARFKIRGKTLVLYLALDPAEHEFSVYHHKDVSDNKSVAGTPMMIKIKSPLGVKKAIRLIDEMLLARGGIKRDVPQRDYAAMYPFETIEELIDDGLVKDVRKNK